MSTDQYEYDVCLSFAGEQRSYVEEVAAQLKENEIRVFYDKYEQVNLWGKDLYEHLDSVYRKKAKYCVLFVSEDYAQKVWTSHERKSAQVRALEESGEYILPVRFDDTELPGLRPTVGYLEVRDTTPSQLVALVCEKLKIVASHERSTPPAYRPQGIPLTPDELQLLITEKPPAWEYLLFGGVLSQGKIRLAPKARDHHLRYARTVRRISDDAEVFEFISDAMARANRLVSDELMRAIDAGAQEWAFGAPGTPGNVDNILHLGQVFVGAFENMYELAADVRGTAVSEEFRRLIELVARLMDGPIRQTGQFIDDYASSLVNISDRLQTGTPITLELDLVLSIDDEVLNEHAEEMAKIRRNRNLD